MPSPMTNLSDDDLVSRVATLAQSERDVTVDLVATLAEFDARSLYLGLGCSSLFTYCTQVLHLSEHAAYGRITAARCVRRFPIVLTLLREGAITLTTISVLAPHLRPENHECLLDAARHKSKREVELLAAAIRPEAAVATSVRKLPTHRIIEALRNGSEGNASADHNGRAGARDSGAIAEEARPTESTSAEHESLAAALQIAASLVQSAAPEQQPVIAPLSSAQYRVQFTISAETYEKLCRAQDLLRHSVPDGDPAAIFDRALSVLIQHSERVKHAATTRPRQASMPREAKTAGSRRIPASVRREVWARDQGRCAFVGAHGRCTERGFLEYHHVRPYARGGKATAENIQLRCRAHNAYEGRQEFGARGSPRRKRVG